MTTELKTSIIECARQYLAAKQLTQGKLALISGVPESYMSAMMNGRDKVDSGGKEVPIHTKYFEMLAEKVGFSTKKDYWPTIETFEFGKMLMILADAKRECRHVMMICDSGAGKSHTVGKFSMKHPEDTFVITANNVISLNELIGDLLQLLDLPVKGSAGMRLSRVIIAVREMSRKGLNPTIIIDEAENLKVHHLGAIKALYDGFKDYASLVLIGTRELIEKLDELESSKKPGIQQFRRRFRAGTRSITTDRPEKYKPFFDYHKVPKDLRDALNRLCRNYGELRDYLEPVLRHCDLNKADLTLDAFKLYHDMPFITRS